MNKIIKTLAGDLTIVRLIISILAFILSMGFFLASADNTNYQEVNILADKRVWAAIFLIHDITLFITVIYELPTYLEQFLNLVGIWLWSYVFLSFTFYDASPTEPTEWMLVMPVILEFWLLTERMFEKKK